MGRQAYMNRLALGRSPYEAPESSATHGRASAQRRTSVLHADGYVQSYDERGHPINFESKQFGRELRRAKNDILSTMGIVVSGEDGSLGMSNEQQKINLIATENDYGLIMATLDQILVFLSSWSTSALAGRVQTFSSYTRAPLMSIMHFERASAGLAAFDFAGIPAWTVSSFLSITRHQPLDRLFLFLQNPWTHQPANDVYARNMRLLFSILRSLAKSVLLVLSVRLYMHSLLQSLHLIPPFFMPSLRSLVTSAAFSPVRSWPFSEGLSFRSLGGFLLGLLKAPTLYVYLHAYLRPIVEVRLYRLIRRRLPKPCLADEHSLRVAYENDLIDWMLPNLGRRSIEENGRSQLTLFEDVAYEVYAFGRWVMSFFVSGRRSGSERKKKLRTREVRMQSLRHRIEELQSELGAAQTRTRLLPQPTTETAQSTRAQTGSRYSGSTRTNAPNQTSLPQVPIESLFNMDQVFPHEENRISQSPLEMGEEYFADISSVAPPPTTSPPHGPTNAVLQTADEAVPNGRNSRSNTLTSPMSSPETSHPTSPRVRASLIHQSSDIITMQLELLTNRNGQSQNSTNAAVRDEGAGPSQGEVPYDRRSITEFLDTLVASQNANPAVGQNTAGIGGGFGLPDATDPTAPVARDDRPIPAPESQQPQGTDQSNPISDPVIEMPATSFDNESPEIAEEPPPDYDVFDQTPEADLGFEDQQDLETRPPPSRSTARPRSTSMNYAPLGHRVTVLSAHPVDSVASHMASILANVLFIPLESVFLRSLASAYLSSPGSYSSLRHDILPMGAWAGGGSVGSRLAYMGKLIILTGMQVAINCGAWSTITGVVTYIGRRYCGWGTL